MAASKSIRALELPYRVLDRLRWEWREWHRPSRSSFQHEELDHALLDLIPWTAGERVLDVGCAHGQYLRELSGRDVDVHGLDISPALLKSARHLGRPLVAASGDRLPFADRAFDSILCHKTLYVFDSPEKVLSEFSRILRPNGRLVFSTSATRTPYALAQRAAVRLLRRHNWACGNRLGPREWVKLAQRFGLDSPRIYSCNLVVPIVFRVCDRWLVPNEWMRRYSRLVRRMTSPGFGADRPHWLAQDFVIELRQTKDAPAELPTA